MTERIDERLQAMGVDASGMTDEQKFTAATGLTRYTGYEANNPWYVPGGAANVPAGAIEPVGPTGETGATGTTEPVGPTGETGATGATGSTGEVITEDNAYLTPTRTVPTAEDIAAISFPTKPTVGQTLITTGITKPTELYLVYPSEWVTANADNITNPVITDTNNYAQGALVNSTVTVNGVEYTIIVTELGKDTYTITFN